MKYWYDQMKEHYYETNFRYVNDILHLGEKIGWSKKSSWLFGFSRMSFLAKINKIKFQFYQFCTLFTHTLQIHLNT